MFQPCLLIYAISLNIQGQNFLGVVCRGGVGCIACYYLSQIFFVTWVGAGLSVDGGVEEVRSRLTRRRTRCLRCFSLSWPALGAAAVVEYEL